MNSRYQKITTVTALLVTLAVGQLYIGATFAEVNSNVVVPAALPAAQMGVLSTTSNKPITVNGAGATSGAGAAVGCWE